MGCCGTGKTKPPCKCQCKNKQCKCQECKCRCNKKCSDCDTCECQCDKICTQCNRGGKSQLPVNKPAEKEEPTVTKSRFDKKSVRIQKFFVENDDVVYTEPPRMQYFVYSLPKEVSFEQKH